MPKFRKPSKSVLSARPRLGLSGADAAEKINAGAALVQIYSGLIYRGPALVGECCATIRATDSASS